MTYKHPATATGTALITATNAAAARTAIDFRSGTKEIRTHVDLRDWDAVRNANWKTFLGAQYTVGSATLASSGSTDGTRFTADDVGKIVMLLVDSTAGANVWHKGTIISVSGTTATLNAPITTGPGYVRCRYGFDGTTALQAALNEIEATALTPSFSDGPVDVHLGGNYRLTQLCIPEHITLRGVNWNKTTVQQIGYVGMTVLAQLPGAQKDFIVFGQTNTPGWAPQFAYNGIVNLMLQGPENNVVGLPAATVGNGVAFRGPDGTVGGVVDGFRMERIRVYNFPESGFRNTVAIPFYINECLASFNGRYGFEHYSDGAGSTNAMHFTNFSSDWNNLGGVLIHGLKQWDSVIFDGWKSEGITAADTVAAGTRGGPGYETNALVLDNCHAKSAIQVNGLHHIRVYRSFAYPGPAIRITGSSAPIVSFNTVNCQTVGHETSGDPALAVTLRDETVSPVVSIPSTVRSGFYPSLVSPTITSPTVLDDAGNKLIDFVSQTNAKSRIQIYNNSSGNPPIIAVGDSTASNVSLSLQPKGAASVSIGGATVGGSPPTIIGGAGSGNYDLDVRSRGTGQVKINGVPAVSRNIQTVTASTTLTALGDYVVFISGASGAVILPTVVGNTGRYTLKNVYTATKTITPAGSETIDGNATLTLQPGQSVDLVSDGTTWRII